MDLSASSGDSLPKAELLPRASAQKPLEKNQVRNESGEFVAVAFYNATQTFSVAGVLTGSSGLASAAPGVALTLANTATNNGVAAGLIVVDDVDVSKGNTEFKKISINATQYPLITS